MRGERDVERRLFREEREREIEIERERDVKRRLCERRKGERKM